MLFPARWDSVIAVAATDQNDVSPCFSSTGLTVELAAPGVSINSTAPGGGYQVNGFFYGAANGLSGTDGKAIFEARNAPGGCYQTLVAAVLAGTRSWDAVTPPNQYCK